AVAGAAEVLGGIEAPARDPAARADPSAARIPGADRLRGVLDERDAAFGREREQGVVVGGAAEQVDHDDRAQPRAALGGGARRRGIEAVGGRVDVGEDRAGAEPRDRPRRREEREGRADHLVAGADAERLQREQQRVGARGAADRPARLDERGQLVLEGRDLLAEHERLALEDAIDRRADLLAQGGVLRAQVEEGDRLAHRAPSRAEPRSTSRVASRSISARKRGAEKRSAWPRIAFGSKKPSAASKRCTARTSASGVCSSNHTPVARAAASGGPVSGRTVSRAPPRPKATTGRPAACTSSAVIPKSSSCG